jgi:hypothetical protein
MARNPTRRPRGWDDLISVVESLERRVATDADDADARYQLAVLLLEVYSWTKERSRKDDGGSGSPHVPRPWCGRNPRCLKPAAER